MSTQLSVEALRGGLKDGAVLEGYRLHRKFLVKIFALANKKPAIKQLLMQKGFYLPINNPKQKREIIKKYREEFFNLLGKEDLEFLVPKKFVNDTLKFRNADELLKADDRDLKKFPHLLRVKNDLASGADKGKVNEYLNSWKGIFEIFLNSTEVDKEINEGMTIDIRHQDAKEIIEKDILWKLHVNIDMSKDSKNTQEKVDIAYNILLQKAKNYGIRNLKLVVPFANIDDMWGREISIYLKSQGPGESEKIHKFISEIERAFSDQGILATPKGQRNAANKAITGSKYFSFRNEYANNPDYYFLAASAKTLTDFLNKHHEELAEYYGAEAAQKEKLGNLLGSLSPSKLKDMMTEVENLYTIVGVDPDVSLSDFFERDFRQFLGRNISVSLVVFLSPPHSPHNPFKLNNPSLPARESEAQAGSPR